MSASEAAIERELQGRRLNAPRLTPEHIDAQIIAEEYIGPGDYPTVQPRLAATALGCLTICVLVLRNGFTVVGKSACASPDNFNAEMGRKIARENARRQIWDLEGYALKTRLSACEMPT